MIQRWMLSAHLTLELFCVILDASTDSQLGDAYVRRPPVDHMRRRIHVSYEEEDTCCHQPRDLVWLPLFGVDYASMRVCMDETTHTHTHTHTHTYTHIHTHILHRGPAAK